MADTLTKEFKGVAAGNIASFKVADNTDLTINIKSQDDNSVAPIYKVSGDNVVLSKQDQYALTLKLGGKIGSGDDAVTVEEKTYTFTLVNDTTLDSGKQYVWRTTYTKADGTTGNIDLAQADIKHAAGTGALAGYTNITADFDTLNITNTVNGTTSKYDYGSTDIADDTKLATANKALYDSEINVQVTLEGYAKAKSEGSSVTVNSTNIDTAADLFEYTKTENKDGSITYTGSRFNEKTITATSAAETFDLGAGTDKITFADNFGKDTVKLTAKEDLTLDLTGVTDKSLSEANLVSYAVSGDDVVVTKSAVQYTMTAEVAANTKYWGVANVSGTDSFGYTADGDKVTITFTLEKYPEDAAHSGSPDNLAGKYMWRSDKSYTFPADYVDDGKHKAGDTVYIWLDDVTASDASTVVIDATSSQKYTYSNVKVYESVAGGEAVDVTSAYAAVLYNNGSSAKTAAQSLEYNDSLVATQPEGIITIKEYAKGDAATAKVTTDADIETKTFGVVANNNTYTGSRLNETVTSTSANEKFVLGSGQDTINLLGNFGSDTIVTGAKREGSSDALTINMSTTALKADTAGASDAAPSIVTYSTDDKGNVVATKSAVKYTMEATVASDATYYGTKVADMVNEAGTKLGTGKMTFSLVAYDSTAKNILPAGSLAWRSDYYYIPNPDSEHVTDSSRAVGEKVYIWLKLGNSDLTTTDGSEAINDQGSILTAIKVYEKIGSADAVEVTKAYVKGVAAATGTASDGTDKYYSFNQTLFNSQYAGTATIEGYASAADGRVVTIVDNINGSSTDFKDITISKTVKANYTGSNLAEDIIVSKDAKAITIDVKGGTNTVDIEEGVKANLTVKADNGANTITTGAGADKVTVGYGYENGQKADNTITTGAGDDVITVNGISDEDLTKLGKQSTDLGKTTITAGKGADTITIGKNTNAVINFAVGDSTGKGDTLTLNGASHELDVENKTGSTTLSYASSGKDLVITRKTPDTGNSGIITDTITVKDFLTDEAYEADNTKVKYTGDTSAASLVDKIKAVAASTEKGKGFQISGKGKIEGTWANEYIEATGAAQITAGKGDDIVKLAKGTKGNTVTYNVGDAPSSEQLTLNGAKGVTIVLAEAPAEKGFTFSDTVTFAEDIKEHTLTITRVTTKTDTSNNSTSTTTDVIVVTDYLTNGEGVVKITDKYQDWTAKAIEEVAKVNVTAPSADFTGSFLSETIAAPSANATIKTGAGDDIVTSGSNNETVIFDGAGEKTFVYDISSSQGDDTITLDKADKLVLDFSTGNKTKSDVEGAISAFATTTNASTGAFEGVTITTSQGTIALKDYLAKAENLENVLVKYWNTTDSKAETAKLSEFLTAAKATKIDFSGEKEGATINGSVLSDEIVGTDYADVINSNGGNDKITAGKGDDTINVKEGNVELVFKVGDSAYTTKKDDSGKETVLTKGDVLNLAKGTSATLDLTDKVTTPATGADSVVTSATYEISGNDAIITKTTSHMKSGAEEPVEETVDIITIKDYMKLAPSVTINGFDEDGKEITGVSLASLAKTSDLIKIDAKTITGTKLNDTIDVTTSKKPTLARTIKAGEGDDIIRGGLGNDTINAGEGTNKIVFFEGAGKDTVVNGGGTDTLAIFVDGFDGTGKVADYADFTTKGNDLIISYGAEKADQIVVKNYVKDASGKTPYAPTVAIYNKSDMDNYMAGKAVTTTPVTQVISPAASTAEYVTVEAPATDKPSTVKGSTIAETIVGSEGNNTIKGGGGNDVIYAVDGNNKIMTQSRATYDKTTKTWTPVDEVTVYAGLGKDTITAGKGKDTYVFDQGTLNGVLTANKIGTVVIDLSQGSFDGLAFVEQGKNLLITNTYTPTTAGGKQTVETLTIKNYLAGKFTDNVLVKDASGTVTLKQYLASIQAADSSAIALGNPEAIKAQKLTGSFLDETFVGGLGKNTISTGAGKDIVFAGLGSDKITGYIAKEGKVLDYTGAANAKTFVFDFDVATDATGAVTSALGSGKDTIVNAKAADTIVFALDQDNLEAAGKALLNELSFTRNGNNLVINYGLKNDKGAYDNTITISNYYKLDADKQAIKNIVLADDEGNTVTSIDISKFAGSIAKKATVELTKEVDTTTNVKEIEDSAGYVTKATDATVDGTGTITYPTGADNTGNTTYILAASTGTYTKLADTAGNDSYTVNMSTTTTGANPTTTALSNVITINDTKGTDELVVTSLQGVGAVFFEVNKNGTTGNDLFVLDTALLGASGHTTQGDLSAILSGTPAAFQQYVKIEDQFNGAEIETITQETSLGEKAFDVNAIKDSVANWLTAGGRGYANVTAALSDSVNAADNAAALLAIYQGQV